MRPLLDILVHGRVLVDGTTGEPRLDHPEGIAVAPDGTIWCGGERGQIYRIPADGSRIEEVASTGGFCLGITSDAAGMLWICDMQHAAVFRYDPAADRLECFADGAGGRRFRIPNAIAIDHAGRLYVSDSHEFKRRGPGVWRLEPDGTGELWYAGDLDFANGVALAPDGSSLYVVETFGRAIARIPIVPGGGAGERELVARTGQALPDGIVFGPDGRLYVGCYEPSLILRVDVDTGAVACLAHDVEAHLLCHPTNLAFRADGRLLTANLGRWHITEIDLGGALPAPGLVPDR